MYNKCCCARPMQRCPISPQIFATTCHKTQVINLWSWLRRLALSVVFFNVFFGSPYLVWFGFGFLCTIVCILFQLSIVVTHYSRLTFTFVWKINTFQLSDTNIHVLYLFLGLLHHLFFMWLTWFIYWWKFYIEFTYVLFKYGLMLAPRFCVIVIITEIAQCRFAFVFVKSCFVNNITVSYGFLLIVL